MPQCRKCGEKYDLVDEYDGCPNCEGGGSAETMSGGMKALFWVVGCLILGAILVATTCSR